MFDAKEALNQLARATNGPNRLTAMIGAKNFAQSKEGAWVSFRFPMKARNRANHVKISLNSNDLYDVEFGRIHGTRFRVVGEARDMFGDALKPHFEEETGLHLSL